MKFKLVIEWPITDDMGGFHVMKRFKDAKSAKAWLKEHGFKLPTDKTFTDK